MKRWPGDGTGIEVLKANREMSCFLTGSSEILKIDEAAARDQ